MSVSRSLDLWENARLFGLLNLAMADGYIATVEAKYHYNFWRPITAIRLGDTDGNPGTVGVPTHGTTVRILDPDGEPMPVGQGGPVHLASALRLDGYTEEGKVAIARHHLLPRQLQQAGLQPGESTPLAPGDTLVLSGSRETRARAEQALLAPA